MLHERKTLGILIAVTMIPTISSAREVRIESPDQKAVVVISDENSQPEWSLTYDGKTFIQPSPIGLKTDFDDFSKGLKISDAGSPHTVKGNYKMRNTKKGDISFTGNEQTITFNDGKRDVMKMQWHVQDNDLAFRYEILPEGDRQVARVMDEETLFGLPVNSTTFLSEMATPMEGWMRTYPSYESFYFGDVEMDKGLEAPNGYVFPALFKVGDNGWLQISETGVGSNYSGSHLIYKGDGNYKFIFPDEREFNGNGTAQPGLQLPGFTPWRTATFGKSLAPIAETTIQFDLVEPLYEPSKEYEYGRGTWSWIICDDPATIYPVQKEYVDFAHDLGYNSVLVDAKWDTQIGREGMEKLAKEAAEKGVYLYVWYSSNGYWNDAPLTPRGIMDNTIKRRKEMKWLKDIGARGIKVDFVGSDKQQAMKLYEDILADSNDYGLMVIFHGSTLPRGWEKMYPNFIANEAVRASENLRFMQEECEREAYNATFLPVSRNAMASVDFGGSTLNTYYNKENKPGSSQRKTSDVFALATAVMFQSPVQHFAMSPAGNANAPVWAVDFMKEVPSTWDDIMWIEGYPGKNVAMARKNGDKWYVVAINASDDDFVFEVPASLKKSAKTAVVYTDDKKLKGTRREVKVDKLGKIKIPKNGGAVVVL